MNRPITIADALTGNIKPIRQLRYQFTCPSCGRDNGMTDGAPLRTRCIGFNCWTEIEAETNPLWTTAGTESPTVPTGDQRPEFVSKMLLTTVSTGE